LPQRYVQAKSAGTAIYYLLEPGAFSKMHRLPTDEIYHFYLGGPVRMLQLGPGGGRVVTLGNDLLAGHLPQLVVPRGVWQGSELIEGNAFALLGTTMAPGFDFTDFEAANPAALQAEFPAFADMIAHLTR
jgi:predicted cupin superfamily sugar epimerase